MCILMTLWWYLSPFPSLLLPESYYGSASPDAPKERWSSTSGGRRVAAGHCLVPEWGWGEGAHGWLHSWNVILFFYSLFIDKTAKYLYLYLQRQKNSYSMYPKTDPTPVTSSAPPVSTLYTSPVVRLLLILLFSPATCIYTNIYVLLEYQSFSSF